MIHSIAKEFFRTEIRYLDQCYEMTVLEVGFIQDHRLYKVKLNKLRYWLINSENGWHLIADFLPTAKLRAAVINELERLTNCLVLHLPRAGTLSGNKGLV